jgi:hypothetical protein
MVLENLTTLQETVSLLRKFLAPLVLASIILLPFPGCYVLEDEEFQGRAPSIFYVEAFEKNSTLYNPLNVLKGLPPTDFEKYEQLEPSYTYANGTTIFFFLFMDDDLINGSMSFNKPKVEVFINNSGVYELQGTLTPAFGYTGIQQIWGTDDWTITVSGSSGDIYKYVIKVSDTDGNESEPAEVLLNVE